MPKRSRTESRARRIKARTSAAVAAPSLTMTLAWRGEMTAPPRRAPFRPQASISRPETDYGYLEVEEGISNEGLVVSRFVEKPGREEAEACVRSGCFWNAGIFVFRPSRFLAEARRVARDLVEQVELYRSRLRERDDEAARRSWGQMPSVSIDYAVMEKAGGVRAVPLRAGWSDVGTWRSVRELRGPSDDRGNLILSEAPVLAPGVRETAIVVSEAGVLVLPFDRESELRTNVERLLAREEEGGKAGAPAR